MKKQNGYLDLNDCLLIFFVLAGMFLICAFLLYRDKGSKAEKIDVYDFGGNLIKHWEGEFDLHTNSYGTYFDKNGQRTIIHGGIVIAE